VSETVDPTPEVTEEDANEAHEHLSGWGFAVPSRGWIRENLESDPEALAASRFRRRHAPKKRKAVSK
jgi:hypothetical protein